MFKTIRNAWSIPDLRKKLLFTLLIIIVFRIGSVIPVPFLDQNALAEAMKLITDTQDSSNMLAYLNTLSGGAFSNATLFAMGITPYINSSIIIQLLCVAIPPLERLTKEGEAGRRKIGTITRYVTVALGLIRVRRTSSTSRTPQQKAASTSQFITRASRFGSRLS